MSFLDLESLTDEDKRADFDFYKVTAHSLIKAACSGSQAIHLIEAIENDEVSSDFSQLAFSH